MSSLLKKHSLSEIIKLNKHVNLCDIWRVRNPHKKLFTFRQKHFTGILQRRFGCIFVSNSLQESIKKTESLNALSSDNSPVFCFFVNNDTFARGSGVWKLNNSLLLNNEFFLNLEKHKAINTTVRHLIDDDKDIIDLKEINACICKFYKNLSKKNVTKLDSEKKSFLNSIALPNLTSKSFDICKGEITEIDLITALKSMPNGKSPGNDGLTKEFYEHFFDNLQSYFINSLKQSKIGYNLSISQRQAVKLIAKKMATNFFT